LAFIGNAYFKACRIGAEEAAKDLDVKLIWDGHPVPTPPSKMKSSIPGGPSR
jgi:hypothetical protein